MIGTNYNMVSHFLSSYDNDAIILQRVADFFDPRDMVHCECVCKLWRTFCEDQGIWMQLSLREGVPLVGGRNRNRRKDFQALYPITISGARISQTIGKVEGGIPLISEVFINALNAPDPFEKGKLMKDTWVFVVVPARIRRTAGVQTPLDFDKGNLVKVPGKQVQNGKELVIPLSLQNLKMLCSYPLKGMENTPVFALHSHDECFKQCGACSEKANVYFMRRCIAEESRNLTYAKQKELVEGFDITSIHPTVTPLLIRALFNAIVILESGMCPDAMKFWARARCPDIFHSGNHDHYAEIGSFTCHGLDINSPGLESGGIGVVPGISCDNVLQ